MKKNAARANRVDHGKNTLLTSYNRQCPDCRAAVRQVSEPVARRWLATEAVRRQGRIRLQNAISIWQQAAKRCLLRRKEPTR